MPHVIGFSGSNFFPRKQFMRILYGKQNTFPEYECELDEEHSTNTELLCLTASWAAGYNLVFTLALRNNTSEDPSTWQMLSVSNSTFMLSYPIVPLVTSVQGCQADANRGASVNCPTQVGFLWISF
jgi:hypothetical protein